MNTYHKIQTVFKRDSATRYKTVVEGMYSKSAFEYLEDNEWLFTEKVDGTNIRVMFRDGKITFGGKTDNASIPAPLMNILNETFLPLLPKFMDVFKGDDVCLYGEGYGAKIQKGGGNYRSDQGFVLFDVRSGDWWLRQDDLFDVATQLDLATVPVIGSGTLSDMVQIVKGGFSSTWGNFEAEGIVAKPVVDLQFRNGSRVITKLKCKDFRGAV